MSHASAFRNEIPFIKDLGVEFLVADAGRASVVLQLCERHLNSWNVAHGGVLMTSTSASTRAASPPTLNERQAPARAGRPDADITHRTKMW
ncbi:MAG: PaaI family thioesterase [Steroidobacteraceae bacterium]